MFHLTVASFRRLAGLLLASSWICRQQAHRRMTSYTLSHLAAGAPKNWLDMRATTIRRPTTVLLHRGLNKYTVSQKEVGHFYFYDNLGKKWTQFHIFFSLTNSQKGSAENAGIKTTTSPQICCRTTLQNFVQMFSFTAHLNMKLCWDV